jgi:hypothetical protein
MRWLNMITRINRLNSFCKKQIWIVFLKSHFTFRNKTQQNKLLTSSQQIAFFENNQHFQSYQLLFFSKKKVSKKTIYNRHVLEKKILKIIKLLFLFIIVCYFKNLITIQSFREIKKRN